MPTPFEAEISQMLSDGSDPTRVADDLVRRWERNLLTDAEQIDCSKFLVATNQYIRFFEQIIRLCEERKPLPWMELAEALGRGRVKIETSELQALIDGAREQNSLSLFVQSKQLDLWDRQLPTLRAEAQDEKINLIAARKAGLRERLDFMRSQRLASEEAKVLDEIQMLFPNDPQFANEKEAFKIRWANEIIGNSAHLQLDLNEDLLLKSETLEPQLETSKALIVQSAKEWVAKNPQTAYDLALAMHFMEFNAEAIDLLSLAARPADPALALSIDWLRLELMIRARQYVSVLDYSGQIEIIYANDPETAFAVTYARARALWGLGQHSMAVNLLGSLVRIRPNYRSASSLLMDWTEAGGGR